MTVSKLLLPLGYRRYALSVPSERHRQSKIKEIVQVLKRQQVVCFDPRSPRPTVRSSTTQPPRPDLHCSVQYAVKSTTSTTNIRTIKIIYNLPGEAAPTQGSALAPRVGSPCRNRSHARVHLKVEENIVQFDFPHWETGITTVKMELQREQRFIIDMV